MTTTNATVLSQRVQQMAESETLKMAAMARELKAQGHNIINLSLGEPDFDTPEHIKAAAKAALDAGITKYTPVAGLPELREAICTKFRRDNQLEFSPNQIVVSNGAKQSLANIFMALLDPGDEVIILAPYWVSYSEIVKLAEGVPVILPSTIDQAYKVPAEAIAAAITPRTKAVLFSSPCNPTGSVYHRHELEAIANVVAAHPDIYIVADEIYEYINFMGEHVSIGAFPAVKEQTITVNGFAKGFAMTGWRLGYLGGPTWLADACTKIQGQITSGANSFSQKAAAHALLADLAPTYAMREAFRQRRDLIISLLSTIPGMKVNQPEGAFYLFPDISAFFGKRYGQWHLQNANDFCDYLMLEAHVATVSGAAFGSDHCFRLSYAASEAELRQAADRMRTSLARLV